MDKGSVSKAFGRALKKTYLKKLKENTPSKTGKTRLAWKMKEVKPGIFEIINEQFGDIIRYLDEGTGLYGPTGEKYIIMPKSKKSLKFIINGQEVFAKKVVHPGLEARHFIDETFDDPNLYKEFEYWFSFYLDESIDKFIRKFAKRK